MSVSVFQVDNVPYIVVLKSLQATKEQRILKGIHSMFSHLLLIILGNSGPRGRMGGKEGWGMEQRVRED